MFKWLSEVVTALNNDKEGVIHCWSQAQLLRTWERVVQVEASGKVKDLFPNMTSDIAIDLTNTEDSQAGYAGAPFTDLEHNEAVG